MYANQKYRSYTITPKQQTKHCTPLATPTLTHPTPRCPNNAPTNKFGPLSAEGKSTFIPQGWIYSHYLSGVSPRRPNCLLCQEAQGSRTSHVHCLDTAYTSFISSIKKYGEKITRHEIFYLPSAKLLDCLFVCLSFQLAQMPLSFIS